MTTIRARYGFRAPRSARPREDNDVLWVALVLVGALLVGLPAYFRDAAAAPPSGLSYFPDDAATTRRDSWCPTPEDRERADDLIPPVLRLDPDVRRAVPQDKPEPPLCIMETPVGREWIAREVEMTLAVLGSNEVPVQDRIADSRRRLSILLVNIRGGTHGPAEEGGER